MRGRFLKSVAILTTALATVSCAMREEIVATGRTLDNSIEFQARRQVGVAQEKAVITAVHFMPDDSKELAISLGGSDPVSLTALARSTHYKWLPLDNPVIKTPGFKKGDWMGLDRSDISVYAHHGVIRKVTIFPKEEGQAVVYLHGRPFTFPMSISDVLNKLPDYKITISEYVLKK